jgi:hypothetical protein
MSDADFDRALVDASQLVSVILVFLSVLFGLKYQLILDTISTQFPDESQPDARLAYRQRLARTLCIHVIPVGLPSLLMMLLLIPDTIQILRRSHVSFADVDLIRTLFLGIEVFLAAATLWILILSIRIVIRVVGADHARN